MKNMMSDKEMNFSWFQSKIDNLEERINRAQLGEDLSIKYKQLDRAKNNLEMFKRSFHILNVQKIIMKL
jgi:hypothetical protein